MIDAFPDKTGYALCTFAYCAGPGQDVHVFEGKTEGTNYYSSLFDNWSVDDHCLDDDN